MAETISSFLTKDHRACDEVFAQMENEVASENWANANKKFEEFRGDLEHHFNMEEQVMFPAFEQQTGMMGGPTAMMRMEHEQMRNVVEQMKKDLDEKNKNHFFGLSESLMMIIQQHNMKEEQMLYAMADNHLGASSAQVVQKMKELER
ncbi:MAG: hemerythrin domain-containing protein [Sulfurimonadaceae bacterium]|jgi:hemerythrin-like domain-containing protein|nr:hemerythrin domain-containing protein [Arcobacteraceae bacterium]MDX9795515.1 hemerythrin domain-containing protein [Arcobacteraceae bacterium]PKN14551.1 MAG: hemerythrin HHE cation-binding protein [Deltaproteobacteria bacterium HGW-Deltaproteobacteria-24]